MKLGPTGFVLRLLRLVGPVVFVFAYSMGVVVIIPSFRSQFSSVVCSVRNGAKADTRVFDPGPSLPVRFLPAVFGENGARLARSDAGDPAEARFLPEGR